MLATPRVLDLVPVDTLADHIRLGGGAAVAATAEAGGEATLAVIEASGLRGRGGAGFPTATKWRSVLAGSTADTPTKVVVNAAEGEPGTFKDRAILRANPYRVLEGALVAALTVGADEVVVATKASFTQEVGRLRAAIDEITAAGWAPQVKVNLVTGPDAYLFGEETALLEVVEGRQPFPRLAPPWQRGVDDAERFPQTARVAGEVVDGETVTVVNNVETLANVALIVANGPEWFRELGTEASPGTVVCTVSGRTREEGVIEVPLGTPLRAVIEAVGHRPQRGEITAVLSGVSNPLLPASLLDTPLTYEDLREAGAGLGSAGFIVFDEGVDPVAIAQGVARFLAVESCGQCTPCKQDGLAIASSLAELTAGQGSTDHLARIDSRLGTIETGARCFLATQHREVVESFLVHFPEAFVGHADGSLDPVEPYLVAELVDLRAGPDGAAFVWDERHRDKQPDWTHDPIDSGQAPVDRVDQRQEAQTGP